MVDKVCSKCLVEKPIGLFYKDSSKDDSLTIYCKECCKADVKKYRIGNRDKVLERKKEYREENKGKVALAGKVYRDEHSEEIKARGKLYRSSSRDKINARVRYRYNADPKYRIAKLLRRRLRLALLSQGARRGYGMGSYVGCSISETLAHLQKTAESNGYVGFDINSYSGEDYHVDHIVPCNSFNLVDVDEQKKCFHYTNLQILRAEDNFKKSDEIMNQEEGE